MTEKISTAQIIEECLARNFSEKEIGEELKKQGDNCEECFLVARRGNRFLCLPVNGNEAKTLSSIIFNRMYNGEDAGIELGEIDLVQLNSGQKAKAKQTASMKP